MVCLPNTPVKVEASRRGESSTSHIAAAAAALHTPDSASHRCGRRRTDISLQECSVLSSVPACSASMPLRSASHPDHVSVPVSRTYHTPGTPLEDEPRRNASSHRGGEHPKAPEGTHKTSPKHARKGAKRQAATRKAFASKVPKKKRRIDVSDRAEGDVLEAAQILVTISHVGHAAHPQATPHVVHPATPPESVKTPVPSRRPAASLPVSVPSLLFFSTTGALFQMPLEGTTPLTQAILPPRTRLPVLRPLALRPSSNESTLSRVSTHFSRQMFRGTPCRIAFP